MIKESVYRYIMQADGELTDALLQAVLERRKLLFPDWEMLYIALPKQDAEKRAAILKGMLELETVACAEFNPGCSNLDYSK